MRFKLQANIETAPKKRVKNENCFCLLNYWNRKTEAMSSSPCRQWPSSCCLRSSSGKMVEINFHLGNLELCRLEFFQQCHAMWSQKSIFMIHDIKSKHRHLKISANNFLVFIRFAFYKWKTISKVYQHRDLSIWLQWWRDINATGQCWLITIWCGRVWPFIYTPKIAVDILT